jgi:hypothetical protein
MTNKLAANKAFTEFKKDPTAENLNKLIPLLQSLIPETPESKQNKLWYELFNKANVHFHHKKAFDMVVELLSTFGIVPSEVIKKNEDVIVFILDWPEHEKDGQAGLYLYATKNEWDIDSLDPNKELIGAWVRYCTFDEWMEMNCDWSSAYE